MDIKGPNLIKPIQMEGLRVVGDPKSHALKYYLDGADEILFIDAVASLYGRNNLGDILDHAVQNIFVPVTAGGGVRDLNDVDTLLRRGADKVAINSAAVRSPTLLRDAAYRFGSQCVVSSIQAKRRSMGRWECYIEGGREPTNLDVVEWARTAADLGAGEILLTSVDREGTGKGFELDLIQNVAEAVSVPVIASGGLGRPSDCSAAIESGASAVAVADAIHFSRYTIRELKVANPALFEVRAYDA